MQLSNISVRLVALIGLTAASAVISTSCQSTSETAGAQALAVNVGVYPPPSPGLPILRVGVPPLEMGSSSSRGMEELAADQLSTLLVRTDRFEVISAVSALHPIRDLSIEEPEIEELIRGIYSR